MEEAVGAAIGGGIGAALGFLGGGVAAALAGGAGGAVIGAVIGWFFDVIPDKTFRRLAVKDLPALDNFEVPTGGFSYNDRVFLFVARDPADVQGEKRMRLSHVAVSKNADPANNFDKLHDVSSIKDGVAFPAGRWLVHVSPTVIRNSDWPDLPSSQGDGLFMFGTSLYHASNLRLAWAPLTPGQDPPAPGTWRFFAETSAGSAWLTQVELSAKAVTPKMLLDDVFDEKPDAEGKPPQGLGEMSVSWSPQLRRWILTYSMDHVECRVARDPRGPWTKPGQVIFRRADPAASADNGPDTSPVWVGLTPTDAKITRKTVSYAPYQIPRWTRFDRSTRKLTIYYTLSVEDPPYNPQLMRARLTCR